RDVTIAPRKPFVGTLRVEARPVASDQRLEASLASGRGDPPGEAQAAGPHARLLSVERPFLGASALHIPRAPLVQRSGLVIAVLPASIEHGKRAIGVPQELGRSCRLLRESPGRSYRVTNSRPQRRTRPPGSEKNECTRRYRQAKATKRGGTG